MEVQFNEKFKNKETNFKLPGGGVAMLTPPIGQDYWIFRVPLYKDQALVAFPKFTTIGIGFQIEDDWNTNLPYTSDAEGLYEHIEHNRLYEEITKEMIIEAINLLKPLCDNFKKGGELN
jgi:hypothetical protein